MTETAPDEGKPVNWKRLYLIVGIANVIYILLFWWLTYKFNG